MHEQYLSGYFDCKGNIFYQNDQVYIQFTCIHAILSHTLVELYGGTIHKNIYRTTNYDILKSLKHCKIKLPQIQLVDQLIHQEITPKVFQIKLKMLKKQYKINMNGQLSWAYITGLFDANGILHEKHLKIKHKCYTLLECIQKSIGHGNIRSKKYWITDRKDFIDYDVLQFRNYSIQLMKTY